MQRAKENAATATRLLNDLADQYPDHEKIKNARGYAAAVQADIDRLKQDRDHFAQLIKEMRECQVNYFHLKAKKEYAAAGVWLSKSKKLEKEIDKQVAEILAPVSEPKLF